MARRVAPVLLAGCCWIATLGGCGTTSAVSRATSGPRPIPTLAPSLVHQARSVLNGFSTALVDRDVRRARGFLLPSFTVCNRYLGHRAGFLGCLLDDTPLPFRYRVVDIELAEAGSRELIAMVYYYFHPPGYHLTRYQPYYLNLLLHAHGLWIQPGGIPRG